MSEWCLFSLKGWQWIAWESVYWGTIVPDPEEHLFSVLYSSLFAFVLSFLICATYWHCPYMLSFLCSLRMFTHRKCVYSQKCPKNNKILTFQYKYTVLQGWADKLWLFVADLWDAVLKTKRKSFHLLDVYFTTFGDAYHTMNHSLAITTFSVWPQKEAHALLTWLTLFDLKADFMRSWGHWCYCVWQHLGLPQWHPASNCRTRLGLASYMAMSP